MTTGKNEFENLEKQLQEKKDKKTSTWKKGQEKVSKQPKPKKEETTATSLRLTLGNFDKLKKQAYLQDRRQNAITNDALSVYFKACEIWKGQDPEIILENLLKALCKNDKH